MDLFVINRHEESAPVVNEEENLNKVLNKIAKRKLQRIKNKEKKSWQNRKTGTELKAKLAPILASNGDAGTVETSEMEEQQKLTKPPEKTPKKPATELSQKLEGFTILGADNFAKKSKVKRVLPKWLTNPIVISVDLQNLDKKVKSIKCLDKRLRTKLKDDGVKYFFPVQAEVIPWLVKAVEKSCVLPLRDICVSAPTGSGKTLAYVLPIVHSLLKYTVKEIMALVILPTQDLAIQVYKAFKRFTDGTHLDVQCITGNTTFEMEQKLLVHSSNAFGRGMSKVDILVCTAGRLVDHMKRTPGFSLRELKFLVIDEADRVLDNIQNDWLYHLERHISQGDNLRLSNILTVNALKKRKVPQKLLFSATLSQDPEKLQKLSLFQPILFTSIVESEDNKHPGPLNTDSFIGKYTTPKELSEKYIVCTTDLKPLVLYDFIKSEKLTKTIVFAHSVETTHRLAILLKSLFEGSLKIEELSSSLNGQSRNALIDNFCKGNIDVLVCTDALARGIDLPGIQCVISYTPPKYLKTYIHRAGRTARAGQLGTAVTMLEKTQVTKFLTLLQQAGKNNLDEIKISEENLEPLGEKFKDALTELKKVVSLEEEASLIKLKTAKRRSVKRKRKASTSKNV